MKYYDINAESYCEQTFDLKISESIFMDNELPLELNLDSYLKKPVLEIGSGSGRDTLYLSKRGFDVTSIELSQPMIEQAKRLTGLDTFIQGNAVNFLLDKKFGFIFSTACYLHLSRNDFLLALHNALYHLDTGGTLFFTVKKGKGNETDSLGRFFQYYQPEEISEILEELSNIYPISSYGFRTSKDHMKRNVEWINVSLTFE